jgi:uroporphyrinogen decarboxylase
MTGRERVLRTLQYEETDKVPTAFRAESDITAEVMKQLNVTNTLQLYDLLDIDTIKAELIFDYTKINLKNTDLSGCYYDIYGSLHKITGKTDHIIVPALGNAETIDDIFALKLPGADFIDRAACVKNAEEAYSSGRAVYGGVWASLFTVSRSLMGEEKFFVSMYEEPQLVGALVDRVTDYFIELNKTYFEACRDYIDIYY